MAYGMLAIACSLSDMRLYVAYATFVCHAGGRDEQGPETGHRQEVVQQGHVPGRERTIGPGQLVNDTIMTECCERDRVS